MNKTFYVDDVNSDEEYLYVDVIGKGTVVIKKEDEGIVVDIYGIDSKVGDMSEARDPVATTWVHDNDLMEEPYEGSAREADDEAFDKANNS